MRRLLLILMVILGTASLFGSMFLPWFQVPRATADAASMFPAVKALGGKGTILFRGLLVLFAVAGLWFWFGHRRKRYLATMTGAVAIVVVLFFPHFQMVWQPRLTADATWLHIQHENLTWFGGDLFRGQELEATPTQMRTYLSDSPRQVAVMKLPTWTWQQAGLHQLRSLLEWLGYTNTFCQFVGVGWSLAIFGTSCLVLSTFFQRNRFHVSRFRTGVRSVFVGSLVITCVAWYAPMRASIALAHASSATHRGMHSVALKHLYNAVQQWPPLQEDTYYVSQVGLTQSLLGISSPYVDLHRARRLEKAWQYERASFVYRELVTHDVPASIRREACRGILRAAVRALNSGQTAKAVKGLHQVLTVEPCSLKALYSLQIAHGQDGNARGMSQAHSQLSAVYAHLNFPNRSIVLGKSRQLLRQPQLVPGGDGPQLPNDEFEPTSFPAFHQPQMPSHRAYQILVAHPIPAVTKPIDGNTEASDPVRHAVVANALQST